MKNFILRHKLQIVIALFAVVVISTAVILGLYFSSNSNLGPGPDSNTNSDSINSENVSDEITTNDTSSNSSPSNAIPTLPEDLAQSSWTSWKQTVENIATNEIINYYGSNNISNIELTWAQTRSNLINGANPIFYFSADYNSKKIYKKIQLIPVDDSYQLDYSNITDGIEPAGE